MNKENRRASRPESVIILQFLNVAWIAMCDLTEEYQIKAEIYLPSHVLPETQPLLRLCNTGRWKISNRAGDEAGA